MHNTIKYNLEDLPAARKQALEDIKEWMGEDRFQDVHHQFKLIFKENPDFELAGFETMVSFAGIQGFPVRAWHAQIIHELELEGVF